MAKEKLSIEEKFENTEFDLFKAIEAIDKKDYGYYDRLTVEQQKKFNPFMLLYYMSMVKSNAQTQRYYLLNTEYSANKYMFNEHIAKHPKLQFYMLCAISPGLGKQFHQYIPHIRERVTKLKESPKPKEIKDYFKKIYPSSSDDDLSMISQVYIDNHKKKLYLADRFPNMKFDEIELLAEIITDEDIKKYEEDQGNEYRV